MARTKTRKGKGTSKRKEGRSYPRSIIAIGSHSPGNNWTTGKHDVYPVRRKWLHPETGEVVDYID